MNKAFIFDMDGVLVNSEKVWAKYEPKFLTRLMGKLVYKKIKDKIFGSTVNQIYLAAKKFDFSMSENQFYQEYDKLAIRVYGEAKITRGTDELIDVLKKLKFKIGLVTAARPLWVKPVLSKLNNTGCFNCVISLTERLDLKPKPDPDGYLALIKKLTVAPQRTIILEDSNRGIEAAKRSRALTICLKENLPNGYQPKNADIYIEKMADLVRIINFFKNI